MANEVLLKGQAFLSILGAVKTVKGEACAAKVKEAYAGEGGEALRSGTLLAIGWYPVAWYRALHQTIQQVTGAGPEIALEIGAASARNDVTGIYKVVFRLLSPHMLLSQTERLVRIYVQDVNVTITEKRTGYVRLRYDGFVGFDRSLWLDFWGGAIAVMEMAGGKNLQPKMLAGGADGDAFMDSECHWS